ncbi:MAG: protein kinase [Acidobacteria bacterium]|nr:protein kinase [Acidobacteriota bacterium]
MKKCHECDSELTGEESFCPICGILLTPVISAEPEPADELESTIMMPEDEIRRLAGGLDTVAAEATAPAFTEDASIHQIGRPLADTVAEPEQEAATENALPLADEPSVASEPEDLMPEVPMPDILSDITSTSSDPLAGATSDNILVKTSGSLSEEIKSDIEISVSSEISESEIPEPAGDLPISDIEKSEAATLSGPLATTEPTAFDEQPSSLDLATPDADEVLLATLEENEQAAGDISWPEIDDHSEGSNTAAAVSPEILEDESRQEEEPDITNTNNIDATDDEWPDDGESYTSPSEERDNAASTVVQEDEEPPTVLWNSGSIADVDLQNLQIEADADVSTKVENESSTTTDAVADDVGIGIPEEELERHDPFASGAMYDSVRIMEPDVFLASTDRDGQTSPVGVEKDSISATSGGVSAGGAASSQTANNIGDNDTDGRRSAKLKPLPEGTVLNNRYEVLRKIGGGGMGAVYLASDNNLGGVLRAVKEMVQAHIEDEQQEKAINDFKRESTILSTLDHPSIPTIFDYFFDESEGRFYLVMKYISGGDLASRLRAAPEGRLEERTVTEWAIQIADVLEYLHNQPSPIVYRDLKPSNIMVDGNSGRVMLIDFGIARSISQREEKGVTAVGTMGYAPPELFSGNVEPRSDIYSLGSTMFHLLTGADPQSNPLLIFDFQKNPRPRQINPRLSDQIERILMRTVEYTADARFDSASALKQALSEHLEALDGLVVSYGVSEAPSSVSLANQTVFCGFCGQRIVATDLFCAFCGSKQPIAHEGVNSGTYSRGSMTAKLYVEGTGELSPPTFSLIKDENLVGRRDPMSNIFPEIDLSRFDPQTKISRRHARIWRNGSTFLVEDLGSSNGTVVASASRSSTHLVPHKPQALTSGDRIKIGDTTLHFMIG